MGPLSPSTLLLIIILISGLSGQVLAATVKAQVDRNPVSLDESFQLTLTVEGSVDGEPDLEVLKKDFDIIGHNQSNNIQIINGSVSRQSQWSLTLMPKSVGTLTIPALTVGNNSSKAIVMTITQPSATTRDVADVFLEVEVNNREAYVQEQLLYTVRLYRSVGLASASLSEPPLTGVEAVIEKLGDDVEFDIQNNGRTLRVVERRYAIFPQQSGHLVIEPVVFKGQIVQPSTRFRANPLLQNTRSKRLRSESLDIQVKAIPAGFATRAWLPARKVTLSETWQDSPPIFRVGEVVTRTITLNAEGLTAAQLPEIDITMPDGIKYYSDRAALDEQKKSTGISSSRQQKLAIIPAQAGNYTLPEIRLEWWNTTANRSELLRLPQRTITVAAAAAENTVPLTAAAEAEGEPAMTSGAVAASPWITAAAAGFWPWLSLALTIAWLSTYFIMRASNRRLQNNYTAVSGQQPQQFSGNLSGALKTLRQACNNNDPVATKDALLQWGRVYLPHHSVTSLADIATVTNDEIAAEIKSLSECLYRQHPENWQGQVIWHLIDHFIKDRNKDKSRGVDNHALAPLYP